MVSRPFILAAIAVAAFAVVVQAVPATPRAASTCATQSDCPWYYPCIGGLCQCPQGEVLCYRQIEWFECANLMTNRGYCGNCETWCDVGSECVNGKCTGCNGGQTLCNGHCVNTLNANEHCGGCYNQCYAGSNCVNGQCQNPTGCGNGQVRCGGSCTNTANDNRHCGRCDVTCGVGKNCVGGVCR